MAIAFQLPANRKRKIVPPHYRGFKSSSSEQLRAHDAITAQRLFSMAKERMLDINNWKFYAGAGSAEFTLTDDQGNPVYRPPVIGDLVRIKVPGPANHAGDGYDWVRIEAFEESSDAEHGYDLFAFRVRPVANPSGNPSERAHFFSAAATSTFIVMRAGENVTVAKKGRNELINYKSANIWDKIRNITVGFLSGSGFSYPQWKRLMQGLIRLE